MITLDVDFEAEDPWAEIGHNPRAKKEMTNAEKLAAMQRIKLKLQLQVQGRTKRKDSSAGGWPYKH